MIVGAAAYGCATGDSDTDNQGGSSSTTSGTGGGGDEGGGGEGGEGGSTWPCGMNCATIDTGSECLVGQCNTTTFKCEIVYAPDGSECEDGEFCTVDDGCVEGICVGGEQNDCGLELVQCQDIVCNEGSQSCSHVASGDGSTCTPTDLCEVNGQCSSGQCVGEDKDCLFAPVPDECHVSECNPSSGDCEPVAGNDGATCIDPNDPCQVGGSCDGGVCQNTSLKDCSSLTSPATCQVGICDSTGTCVQQQGSDNDPCNDLDGCTTGDICQSGVCTPTGSITTCIDSDGCCPSSCDGTTDSDCALQILLMLDNVSTTNWDAYRTALTAAGKTWTERNLDSVSFPTAAELAPFNTLIWGVEGVESTALDAGCQIVADWLALTGHNLFVAGRDIMWDFENGDAGLGESNLYNMWGMTFVGDYAGTGVGAILGVAGDPIGGSFTAGLTLSGDTYSNGDYADQTLGPAVHGGLYGATGTGTGYSGLAHYTGSGYQVVWLGVDFHNGLTSQTQRNILMTNIMNFFVN